jgi:lysophosphatidylcholine acyltransferase/lyso-PAF acetyltransferase
MGRTPQPFLEYVRLALAAVTVLPIKVVVTLSAIVAFYVVCRLQCLLGRPGFGGRRAAAVAALGSACARWALFGYGFTAVRHERLAYVAGTGPTGGGGGGGGPPPRPGAIVSNHLGYLDVLVHMALTFPSFVARGATKDLTMVGVIR